MFFAAGMYGMGLAMQYGRAPGPSRPFPAGMIAATIVGGGSRGAGAPHNRRRLHDRDTDVRPSRLSDDPLFRACDTAVTRAS